MRHGDLSAGLETTQASVIVRRSAQKSSTMRGSQAQLPLDSGKTRLNDVNTYQWNMAHRTRTDKAVLYHSRLARPDGAARPGRKIRPEVDWKEEDPESADAPRR